MVQSSDTPARAARDEHDDDDDDDGGVGDDAPDRQAILARRAALIATAVAGLGLGVFAPSSAGLGPVAHAQSLDAGPDVAAASDGAPRDAVPDAPDASPRACLTAPRGCD